MASTATDSSGPQPLAAKLPATSPSAVASWGRYNSRQPSPLEAGMIRFLMRMREPTGENPALMTERVAAFNVECKRLLSASGIEERFAAADLHHPGAGLPKGYYAMAVELLTLLAKPKLLAVCGDRGRGKTFLACGLIRAFCGCGYSAIYRRTHDFFSQLSGTAWEKKEQVRDQYTRPDLIVLDEVQVRDSDRSWQDNELTTLIDKRYARQRATLLLSNLTPEALAGNLGPSIWRRIIETGGDPVETDWPRIEEHLAGKAGAA